MFEETKDHVKRVPTLTHFNFSKDIIIVQANASGYGLDAALLQDDIHKNYYKRYYHKVVYVSGQQSAVADSLFRNSLYQSETDADDLPWEMNVCVNFIISSLLASKSLLNRIKYEQEADSVSTALKKYCSANWPSKIGLPNHVLT